MYVFFQQQIINSFARDHEIFGNKYNTYILMIIVGCR